MTVVYIIFGIALTVLLFLNIKNAADIICRIIGGIGVLIIYNTVFPSLPVAGINLVSGTVVGILGLPGGIMVLCLGLFL